MDIITIRGLSLFFCALLNFILSFLLAQKSKGRKDIFHLSFLCFFSGLYAFFAGGTYVFWNSDSFYSVLWYRSTWLGVFMMSPFAIFTYYFTKRTKSIKTKMFFLYLGAIVISFIALTTSLFVKAVKFDYPNIIGIAGPLDFIGRLYIPLLIIIGVYNLLREYFKSTDIIRLQIKYFLSGIFVYAIGGIGFTTIIPLLSGVSAYYDLLAYFSLAWTGLTTYAILRHNLFAISVKVIATEVFSISIAFILLFNIFFSETINDFILRLSLFLAISFLIILLIKSVIKEVETKEALAKLTKELQKANDSLKKIDKTKTEFISITSHQLRTPLTIMKGYISMILEGSYGMIPETVKEKMKNMFRSNEGLIKLVNDLLNISRIELGKIQMDVKKSSIEDIISVAAEELKIEAQEKNIDLIWNKPPKPLPQINIDENKVKQIIMNIVDNAIHYTIEGAISISIELSRSRAFIIKIKDTGAGMTKEEISELFMSFSRGESGSQLNATGAGLGLYVAKKFTEMHKGKIWAESAGKNQGSTFFIEIPLQ